MIYTIEAQPIFFNFLSSSIAEQQELKNLASIADLNLALKQSTPKAIIISEQLVFTLDAEQQQQLFDQVALLGISNLLLINPDSKLNRNYEQLFVYHDDYVSMDESPIYCLKKIQRIIESKKQTDKIAELSQLVHNSLQLTSELGDILHFSLENTKTDSLENLSLDLNYIFNDLKLKVVYMIYSTGETYFFSNNERILELDKQVLADKKSEERFIDFGTRTQVNFPLISILIKNMPTKNKSEYTRIHDYMVYLLSTTNSIISLSNARRGSQQLMKKVSVSIDLLDEMSNSSYDGHMKNIADTVHKMEDIFMALGLTEEQEQEILEIITQAEDTAEKMLEFTNVMSKILAEIREEICLFENI